MTAAGEHRWVQVGERFLCAVCKVRWPCLAKHQEIMGRMNATNKH